MNNLLYHSLWYNELYLETFKTNRIIHEFIKTKRPSSNTTINRGHVSRNTTDTVYAMTAGTDTGTEIKIRTSRYGIFCWETSKSDLNHFFIVVVLWSSDCIGETYHSVTSTLTFTHYFYIQLCNFQCVRKFVVLYLVPWYESLSPGYLI